jgi:hypothetical protein
VLDCQWLQRLHSYGLLTASFRPADQVVVLRSYLGLDAQGQVLEFYVPEEFQRNKEHVLSRILRLLQMAGVEEGALIAVKRELQSSSSVQAK